MDEHTFRAPEPEDNDLPGSAGAATGREDNDLPAADYIRHASSLFNFSGSPEADGAPGDPPTRQVRPPADTRREPYRPPVDHEIPSAPPEGSVPPFMEEPAVAPRQVSSVTPAPQPTSAPVPDADLMPDETENPPAEKGGKMRWILLACGLALLAAAAGAVLFVLINGNPFQKNTARINVPSAMPRTEQEIVDFYRIAVNAVKKDGLAGYRKKAWQSVSSLEFTGIAFVDDLLKNVFQKHLTQQERAKSETYEKETAEAKSQFPPFDLKDLSYVKSAECVRVGDAYQITVVFQHEDTPMEEDSFLGQVTDAALFWDTQIEPVLEDVPQLHAWSDVHVDYVDMTITAEIGADGRFRSMTHTAPAEVTVGSARVGIFTFTDKSLQLESTAVYTDFRY